jgi:ketosteroid isomerase-like protein
MATMAGPESLVRAFYEALDEHAYDDLRELLAPAFTHHRPDRTFEGRATFVSFMREDRPAKDTSHEIQRLFAADDSVAVQGRLRRSDGDLLFRFADVHTVEDGQIQQLRTYTNGHPDDVAAQK